MLERLLKHFSRRQKQTTFVVIGILRVKNNKHELILDRRYYHRSWKKMSWTQPQNLMKIRKNNHKCKHVKQPIIWFWLRKHQFWPPKLECKLFNAIINITYSGISFLSYDVASGSETMPSNKIDKPLVVYGFTGNIMTSITTLRT